MKSILVIRKRSFASALMPYWIVFSKIPKTSFLQSHGFVGDLCDHDKWGQPISRIEVSELDQIGIRIKNGQIMEVPVPKDTVSIFVITVGGSISNESPIGAKLMGARVGQVITVDAPNGKYNYKILDFYIKQDEEA